MWIKAKSDLAWLRFEGWAQSEVGFWMQCPRFEPPCRELENAISRQRWIEEIIANKSHVNVTLFRSHKGPIEVCGYVTNGYIQGPYLMLSIETLKPECLETDFVTECGATIHIKVPDTSCTC